MALPLEGVKIIEMGMFGPGTYGIFMLSDLGAEVIRVEPPPHPTRAKAGSELADGDGTPIPPGGIIWHRSKKGTSLNLRLPEAREVFYDLARTADVVAEANRPGVLDRLGIGYETVSQINPRIIYCSITGFGQEGPYKMTPGHDPCWEGVGGMLYLQGVSLGNLGNMMDKPKMPTRLVTHHTASHYTAIAILAALHARDRTGRGQHVDVSNCDSVVGVAYETPDRHITGQSPAWNLYQTQDGGYVAVGARDERTWGNLCRAIGHPEWTSRLNDESSWERTRAALQGVFKERSRDDWWRFFQDKDTAVAPVLRMDEVPNDPQVKMRDMLPVYDVPGDGEKVMHYGISMKLMGTPGAVRSLAPKPGEHTAELLRGIGYDDTRIEALRAAGAVV